MVIVRANTMSRASWSSCNPGGRNGRPLGAGRPVPVGSVRLMSETATVLPSVVAAAGLAGGFLAGRWTGRRDLSGALFAAASAWCARDWVTRAVAR